VDFGVRIIQGRGGKCNVPPPARALGENPSSSVLQLAQASFTLSLLSLGHLRSKFGPRVGKKVREPPLHPTHLAAAEERGSAPAQPSMAGDGRCLPLAAKSCIPPATRPRTDPSPGLVNSVAFKLCNKKPFDLKNVIIPARGLVLLAGICFRRLSTSADETRCRGLSGGSPRTKRQTPPLWALGPTQKAATHPAQPGCPATRRFQRPSPPGQGNTAPQDVPAAPRRQGASAGPSEPVGRGRLSKPLTSSSWSSDKLLVKPAGSCLCRARG